MSDDARVNEIEPAKSKGEMLIELFEARRYDLASRSDRRTMAEIANNAFAVEAACATAALPVRGMSEEELKAYCVAFYRWWHNQPGSNTEQGYDTWAKSEHKPRLSATAPVHQLDSTGGGWQPIETAPKDGYDILVSRSYLGEPVRLAFWDEARGGQWSIWPGRECIDPTHWMPLPSPPTTGTSK